MTAVVVWVVLTAGAVVALAAGWLWNRRTSRRWP